MFNISQFLEQQKIFGQSKPSFFEVYLQFPDIKDTVVNAPLLRIYGKASQIPGITLNYIEVPYQGTLITVPTSRYLNEWNITVINDTNFIVRTSLEKWLESINNSQGLAERPAFGVGSILNFVSGKRGTFSLGNVFKDGIVIHYSNALLPRPTAIYKFHDMFPSDIGSIDLGWDQNDSVEEYTVTFRYQYWTRLSLNLNNFGKFGSNAIEKIKGLFG